MRFINKKAELYHKVLEASDKLLVIVTWSGGQMLMTYEALEALKLYMDKADLATYQELAIWGNSAASLGFVTVWTAQDVIETIGAGRGGQTGQLNSAKDNAGGFD